MNHPLGIGNAMHHFVVDAGADACGKAVVTLETWGSTHLSDPFFGKRIKVAGCLSRLNHGHHFPQHRGDDATGLAHDFDLTGRFDFHSPTLLNPGSSGCCARSLSGRQ